MNANTHNVVAFADRLTTLAEAYKEDVAAVIEDVKKADLDTPAVRRLSAWQRKDPTKRAEQEAIDHQYRFLAGEVDEPATLPEGELAEAARYYADKLTVRQVSEVMKISVGKAQKLKTLSGIFDVHQKMNVNKVNVPVREMVADDLGDPLWVVDRDRARFKEKVRAIAKAVTVQPRQMQALLDTHADDDLAIPDFLRRVLA